MGKHDQCVSSNIVLMATHRDKQGLSEMGMRYRIGLDVLSRTREYSQRDKNEWMIIYLMDFLVLVFDDCFVFGFLLTNTK